MKSKTTPTQTQIEPGNPGVVCPGTSLLSEERSSAAGKRLHSHDRRPIVRQELGSGQRAKTPVRTKSGKLAPNDSEVTLTKCERLRELYFQALNKQLAQYARDASLLHKQGHDVSPSPDLERVYFHHVPQFEHTNAMTTGLIRRPARPPQQSLGRQTSAGA